MRTRLPPRLTQFSFPRSKLAIALLCCTFSIEPSFAQEVDWAYNGADVNNSRFQSIDQINPSNVSQLKLAWSFSGDTTEAASAEATPLVVDGVMYISGNNDGVFALNPTTGKQIWHYAAPADAGYGTRGVAYGQGLIFSGQGANLVALNAKTGALVWKTQVDPHGNISAAPQFILAGGKVPEVLTGMNTPVGAVMWMLTTLPRGNSCGVSTPLIPIRGPLIPSKGEGCGIPPPSIRPSIWCTLTSVTPGTLP
jgi:PQQ-like domain